MTLRVGGSASKGNRPVETFSERQRLTDQNEAASDDPPTAAPMSSHLESPRLHGVWPGAQSP